MVHTEPFLRLRYFGIPKDHDRFTITPFLLVPDDPGQAGVECSHTDNPLVDPQEGIVPVTLSSEPHLVRPLPPSSTSSRESSLYLVRPSMDPINIEKQYEPEEPRFLDFPHLPDDATNNGKPTLNRYSSTITKNHEFPGAQVCGHISILVESTKAMLYAAGVPSKEAMKSSPHVGIASVWWEGNPCK